MRSTVTFLYCSIQHLGKSYVFSAVSVSVVFYKILDMRMLRLEILNSALLELEVNFHFVSIHILMRDNYLYEWISHIASRLSSQNLHKHTTESIVLFTIKNRTKYIHIVNRYDSQFP